MNLEKFYSIISQELSIKIDQVQATLSLLREGATIPFIARYRKEVTGSLDEVQIHDIQQRFNYLENLSKRKEEVLRLIGEQNKLTDELQVSIENATALQQVEDLYRPYKQKKRTKAMIAIEQGLEPLAKWVLDNKEKNKLELVAQTYLTKEVTSVEEVLAGVHEIIAQWVSDEASYREFIRKYAVYNAVLQTKVKNEEKDAQKVYRLYYDFHEKLSKVRPHSVLAINRSEKEEVINVKLVLDDQPIYRYIGQRMIDEGLPKEQVSLIEGAIKDAYKRFIAPSIERELRNEVKERADRQAISIFGQNLRNLLLTAPLKGKVVMGFDPAYRTGCKLAIINEMGAVLEKAVIYPHEATKGKVDEVKQAARWQKEGKIFKELINRHQVNLIAIGNGTASRESELFVAHMIKEIDRSVSFIVVSEAGASVYSASEIAREEFPDWEASERSAVSIARRVQDPLSELIKIDPQSLGVGQYQHDVSQKELTNQLEFVVNVAVNQVGVDINTASIPLLQHVSGLSKLTAQKIVERRETIGAFTNREDIRNVKRLGPKTYEQAIGFLRIIGGNNPLDQTKIHPESYGIAMNLLEREGLQLEDIGSVKVMNKLSEIEIESCAKELGTGIETLKDIIEGLLNPSADIRDGQATPTLRRDVLTLEDIEVGMVFEGVVRNVVDFGAFVDIGIKQDGLIHTSKLQRKGNKRFIHPTEIISVGQIVDVEVIKLDRESQRIGLKLIKIHGEEEYEK